MVLSKDPDSELFDVGRSTFYKGLDRVDDGVRAGEIHGVPAIRQQPAEPAPADGRHRQLRVVHRRVRGQGQHPTAATSARTATTGCSWPCCPAPPTARRTAPAVATAKAPTPPSPRSTTRWPG